MKRHGLSTILVICCLAISFNISARDEAFKIIVSPEVALYGETFSWKVTGMQPGEKVTIRASSIDAKKIRWESAAVFEADSSGTVDLNYQAPVSGSYAGVDIFGLLWSMKAVDANPEKPSVYRSNSTSGWIVDLVAESSSGLKVKSRFRCIYQKPGTALVRAPLEQDGLSGVLYYPTKGGPFPGVIILGGSEGGLFEPRARALASNGFAVLTLAYFRYPGLPDELVEIPLEYFDQGIAWLSAQPNVKSGGIGLLGGSKGGELALLVASRNSDVKAVVALTPAAHSWEGQTMEFFSPDYQPVASWSLGGKPFPYVPYKVTTEIKETYMNGELASFVPFYSGGLIEADPATVEAATIPVEKISAPVLLISGTDDQAWPAGDFCAAIVARLKQAQFSYEVKHVSIENGGHASVLPFLITANHGVLIDGDPSGGSPQADAQGGYRSWAESLAFLHSHLDR